MNCKHNFSLATSHSLSADATWEETRKLTWRKSQEKSIFKNIRKMSKKNYSRWLSMIKSRVAMLMNLSEIGILTFSWDHQFNTSKMSEDWNDDITSNLTKYLPKFDLDLKRLFISLSPLIWWNICYVYHG